jgi:hypothetical protein
MSTRETPSLIDRRNVLKLIGAAGTWSALAPRWPLRSRISAVSGFASAMTTWPI